MTWREFIKTNERYNEDFTILDSPVPFKELFTDQTIDLVQVHSLKVEKYTDGQEDIRGLCGTFGWENNIIVLLERKFNALYNDEVLVYGYSWFTGENGKKCVDILVQGK